MKHFGSEGRRAGGRGWKNVKHVALISIQGRVGKKSNDKVIMVKREKKKTKENEQTKKEKTTHYNIFPLNHGPTEGQSK